MIRRLSILLATVLILGYAGVAAASGFDITFDGYCDGLHMEIPSIGDPSDAYTIDGERTGCDSAAIFGSGKGKSPGHGSQYVVLTDQTIHTVVSKDHTWVHYALDGDQIFVLNSGTWSDGTPPPAKKGVSSSSTHGTGAAKIGPLKGHNLSLTFDGYCDGMELFNPSVGIPTTKKSVDGSATGCLTQGVMGSRTKIAGQRGTYVITTSVVVNDITYSLQYDVFPDHTWSLFSVLSGNAISLLNSGTWSTATNAKTGARPSFQP